MGKTIESILEYILWCLLIIIYPKKEECPICGISEEEEIVCSKCRNKLLSVNSPEVRMHEGEEFTIYSCVYYTKELKTLIVKFKEKREYYIGEFLSLLLIEAMRKWDIRGDVITYVPLSKSKEKKRGFNQSLFLAKRLGKFYSIPVSSLLFKREGIKEQKKLSKAERYKNVCNAFFASKEKYVRGKRIILIDDIFTTGATLISCVNELKKTGASEVKILTIGKSKL
ncbi:MAG: phosphoribosyltransferase family protein [Clostridiaceae bacterium]